MFLFTVLLIVHQVRADEQPSIPRLIIDQAPITFNPRMAQDLSSQRFGALFFRGLTHLDVDLIPQPDAAASWKVTPNGLSWVFRIRDDLKDQSHKTISAADWVSCLENYRVGKPTSVLASQIEFWKTTQLGKQKNEIEIVLTRPDPYLSERIALLRFFRSASQSLPCREPEPGRHDWIASGDYFPARWDFQSSDTLIRVLPFESTAKNQVDVKIVRDEHRRLLDLLHERVDVASNGLPLSKEVWLIKNHPDRFVRIERQGVNVGYLAFNLKDPVLSILAVRQAIALALDRQAILRYKLFEYGELASSFLSPRLKEYFEGVIEYNPAQAERLLDSNGFSKDKNGIRLTLNYRTTPVREGFEQALMFKDMLKKVGIVLNLEVAEPAVFTSKIAKGQFQLYSSRWIGVANASILEKALQSKSPLNRTGYRNAEVDHWLEQWAAAPDEKTRIAFARQIQRQMLADLPYLPLWNWKNTVVINQRRLKLRPPLSEQISVSGSFEPIIRWMAGELKEKAGITK